jgi:hypothetical protein
MATQLVRVGTSAIETVWVGEPVPPKAWGITILPGSSYGPGDFNTTKPPTLTPAEANSEQRRLNLLRLLANGGKTARSLHTSGPSVPDWRQTNNTDSDPNNDFVLVVIGNDGLGNIAVPGGSDGVVVGRGE